ncbi:MFS family permease [Dokdonella fugitiva]|uniref:MFS family permease n=1 Tax=Dokdonella fugitiva TaxID=328517 RepID=A0A839F184_9GAMM|nr:MFS transporter [Dokdonella fugitiva]MBA8886880.1 MFS family permease [Dokdonella fugitiva]
MIRGVRALPRTVWLVSLISLVNDAASDMIYPLVPLYLASVLMAGPKALGLIEGIAEAVSSVLKLFVGALADRSGKVRAWVIAGYGLAGFARPLIGITTGWLGVLACRFADRVGKGLRSAPRDALISLSIEPGQRGLAFGFHRAMDNLGAVIGPLAAAALLAAGIGLRSVFLLAVVPAIVVLVLAFAVPEPERAAAPRKEPLRWTLADLPAPFRRYLVALALFTLGNSSNMFLLLRANELGASATRTTLMWALFSLVAALLSTPLSALSDRWGRARVLTVAWLAYAVAYLAIGLLPAADWALWLAFAGYGAVTAALEGTEKAFVADLVPRERIGSAYGWYNLVSGLLLLPASLLFGEIWSGVSPFAAFAFGAACAFAGVVLLRTWVGPTAAAAD